MSPQSPWRVGCGFSPGVIYDRTGDIVLCADRDTVLGTRPGDHDLSALRGPLRSHGGLAEREVPMLFNRPLDRETAHRLRNYDAFWVGLNDLAADS